MAYNLNRSTINKKAIDIFINSLKAYLSRNRLYRHTDISDRFSLEQAQIPFVLIRTVSNTQRRVHFDDFIDDYKSRVELIPINADSNLFGNNIQQVNLPLTVDYDPRWPWDNTVGYPSGTDINKTIYRSGIITTPGINTGIIITVPEAATFDPTSISFADEDKGAYTYTITGTNTYSLALALNSAQDQFYLAISGTDMISGTTIPVEPNQLIVDGSGVAQGLSGTRIFLSDVLYAGDRYQLNTTANETTVYEIYGGIYSFNITFECYARTTIEAEELGDLVQRFLVEKKLSFYDETGISLTSWSQGGGSEREYVNEHIFQTTVTAEAFKEWQDYRGVTLITASSGIAIPYGVYSGTYQAPGVYTYTQLNNPSIGGYFNNYIQVSGATVNISGGDFDISGNYIGITGATTLLYEIN